MPISVIKKEYKKIYVVCPANYCSGGPESLHNLVAVMNEMGLNAYISYLPSTEMVTTKYNKYNISVENFDDNTNNLIIFPEIFCMQALKIKNAHTAIWWLSLDNFLETKYGTFRDKIRYFIKVIKGQRPLRGVKSLRRLMHFSKAHYDKEYLRIHDIKAQRIEGPISKTFLKHLNNKTTERLDGILYNEKKNKKIVDNLQKAFPNLVFVPLNNMDEEELITNYQKHKLYIDFGTHPGKERMPREAALMGCCIITGELGAAKNPYDVFIPDTFKINQNSKDFYTKFGKLTSEILNEFEKMSPYFDSYRAQIKNEFIQQVKDLENIFCNN